MKRINLFMASLCCVLSFNALAKQDDVLQELKIQAVRTGADIKNNQVIYYGPVIVTQGSIKITADELRASKNDTTGESIIIATGKPATYSQEMDDGKLAIASAKEIRYELGKRTMALKGDASLDQMGSKVSANQIRYDIEKQKIIAESQGNDRVITIIQPENFQGDKKQPESK